MIIDTVDMEKLAYSPLDKPLLITEKMWPEGTVPLVSICCITYNHVSFIRECIEGFLIQETTFPVEILIHDDASTDGTADIVREYERKYPKLIKPIYQTENQYSKGVKVGLFNLRRAVGAFIALCEGDDYWVDPSKLEKQANVLLSESDVVICYGAVKAIDDQGQVVKSYGVGLTSDFSSYELKKAPLINTLTVMYRKVDFVSASRELLQLAPVGDLTIWARLGLHGRGKFIEDIQPCVYRIHPGGVHSMKSTWWKKKTTALTCLILYFFFLDQNDKETASYYRERVFNYLILNPFSQQPNSIRVSIFNRVKRRLLKFLLKDLYSC